MAESVWWGDGPLSLGPPNHDDEVAEGWLVVATARGQRALRDRYPSLARLHRLDRMCREDGDKHVFRACGLSHI